MLKINELNKFFKDRGFFTTAKSYNDLLGYARSLARNVDSKDGRIRAWEEKVSGLEAKNKNLEIEIHSLKRKYVRGVFRDPKTGRYLKRK